MKREIEIKRPLGRVLVPKIMIKQKVEDIKMTARHQFIKGLTPQRQRLPQIHAQQEQQRSVSVKRQTQLTPIEFLEFISDIQYRQEFCYMTNCGGPYDWKIVDYANRDPNYYMTVSQRGVMIWRNGVMELQSYENFKSEKEYYSKLVKIGFFKNFVVSKIFSIWKTSIKQRKIMKHMQDVSFNLFVLDHIFLKAILNNYNYCYQIQSIYFFEQLNQSYNIQDFEIMVDEKLFKIQDLINLYRNQIFKNSSESCGYHYSKFIVRQPDVNKFSSVKDSVILSQDAETVDYDNNNGIIVQDNTRYIMHYTKKMKENEFKNKLSKYIIYCDQVLKETYIRYYQFNTEIFIKCLQQTITSSNNFGWIVVEVEVQDQDFKFKPSKTEIEQQIFKFFDAIEKSIIDDDSQLFCLETRQNKQFLTVESSSPIKESLEEFLKQYNSNKQYKQIIQSIIDQSFQLLYDNQNFIIEILKFESNRVESEIQLNLEYVKGTFQYYQEAFIQIQQVPVIQDLGLLQLNCSKIITNITNSLKRSSLDINLQFQKHLYTQIDNLQLNINDIQMMIQNKPKNLFEFMQFQKELFDTISILEEIKPQIQNLQSILQCFTEYNQQIKQDISLKVEKLVIGKNQQLIRIHDIESSLFRLKERFIIELKQIIPIFEEKIVNLQEVVNTSEINYYGKEQDLLLAQIDNNLNQITKDYQQLQLFHQYLDQPHYENKNIESLQIQIKLYKELWQGIKEFNQFVDDLNRSHFLDIDVQQALQQLHKFMQIFNQCITLSNDATKQFIEILKFYFEIVESIKYLEMNKKQQIKSVFKFYQKTDDHLKLFDFQTLFDEPMNPLYTIKYLIDIKIYSLKQELKQLYDETIIENQLQEQLLMLDQFLDNQNFITIRSDDFKDLLLIDNCQQLHQISQQNNYQINGMLQNQLIGFIVLQCQQLLQKYQQLEQLTLQLNELEQQLLKSAYLVQTQYIIKHSQKDLRIQQIFQGAKKFWQKQILLCKQFKCLRNWIDGNFNQKIQYNFVQLRSINMQIEQLQILIKIIFDFMEQKRSIFPRLFLLTHQQYQVFILSPLKELNNPIFLSRIFSNIQSISFDKYYSQVNEIKGQNNEILCLKQCFIRGEYEEWLSQLDEYLKNYLKQTIKYAVSRIEFEEQSQMIQSQYHLQILQLIYHIFFVKQIEDILIQESNQFEELYDQLLILNKNLIEYMQKENQYSQFHRSAELLSISIQRRDLIKQFLHLGVSNINDFEWTKQIKYYLEDDMMHFKQLDLKVNYCYEYYGDIIIPHYLFDKQIIQLSQAFCNLQTPILLGNKSKHQVAITYGYLIGKFVFVYDFEDNQEDIQNKFKGITQFQCMLILNQFNGDRYIIDIMKISQAILRTYQLGKQQQIECLGLNLSIPLNQTMILVSDKPLLQFRSINCFQIDYKYLFNIMIESRNINDFLICQSINYFVNQYWFKISYQFYQEMLNLMDNNINNPQITEIITKKLNQLLNSDEQEIFYKFQSDIQQISQQKQKVTKNQKKLQTKNHNSIEK